MSVYREDTPSVEHPHFDLLRSESYVSPSEQRWLAWIRRARRQSGRDLDGDQIRDGYSLDYAYSAWEAGVSVEEYLEEVRLTLAVRTDRQPDGESR